MSSAVRGYLVTSDGSLVYELEEEETCIGRAEGNDIVLTASRSISSRHCRLVIKSSGGRTQARMYDLESLNGTFLNDTHICNSHAELRSGDSLRLGYDPTIYRFYLAGEAPADLLGPTAAPPRPSSAAGSPSHGRTAAGRSTNWEGSGAGRSPLKDYERGGGRGGGGRPGDRTYTPALSPDRLPPAGVTSEQAGTRRRSLTGMSPSSIRARDSGGVGGTLGMGGRYREPEFHPDSPQGRMAARRRSLSAARGVSSSSSSPWEGTGRPTISPTLRRSSSAAPTRSHPLPPSATAARSTSGGGGGGGGGGGRGGWSSTHSPPSGLKPRERPVSIGYPSASQGGHRRVEEEGGWGRGGQPPRHSSSSSSNDGGAYDGGHSHIQPKRVKPWHVVDEERRRGGGGSDQVQEVEPPFARDEDEERGGEDGGYYGRDGGRQGEEEEREREREEEAEMEREVDRAPPPPPQTPQNLKVVGPVSITMAQNGDVESALDSRGEDIRGRGGGGSTTPLASRSRRPSSASFSITAIGPVTVNPPAAAAPPPPFTPQQQPSTSFTIASSSAAPSGAPAASQQRTAALLASMATEPPLAHSPTLDAAVAASKRAGGGAVSPRGGIFTSPSGGTGAAIEQLSNTISSPRVVGQNKILASLEAMKLQAAAAAAAAPTPAAPPAFIHSPRGNSAPPPPPPPTTVATAALANSIHEAELSQRRAAAASAASILAAATASAAAAAAASSSARPANQGGAVPFIPPLPLSSSSSSSSALLSQSQLTSLGTTQLPLSSTSLATSRIASSMPNALEHLATSTSSRPQASRQGRDSPLRLVLDVLGEEREAVKETLSELKTMVSGRGMPQPQPQPQTQSRQQQQQQEPPPPPPPPPPTFTPQQRSAALLLGGLLKKAVKVRLREAFDVWRQHSLVAAAEDDYRVRDELARMLEERRGAILAAVAEEERVEMEAERVRFLEAAARAREEEAAARAREEAAERARWEQTVHIDVSPSRLRTSSALRVSTPNKPGAPVYTMGPSGVVHIHPPSSNTAQQQQQQQAQYGGGNASLYPSNSSMSSAFHLGGGLGATNTTTATANNGGGGAATLSMNATGGSKVSVYADGSISLGNNTAAGGLSQPYPDPHYFPRDEKGKDRGNHWADAVATMANDSREPHPVATIIGVESGGMGGAGGGGTYVRLEHSQPAPVSESTTNTAPKKSFHECTSSRPIWEYADGPLSTTVSSRAKTRSKSPPAVVRRNSLTALGGGGGDSVKSGGGGGGGFPPGGTSGTSAWQASLRRHSIDASQSSTQPVTHVPYTHSASSVGVGNGGESTPSANSSLPPGFKVVLSPSREPGRGPTVTLTTGQPQQQQQQPPPPSPPPPPPSQDYSSGGGGTTLRVHTPGGGTTSISSGGGGGGSMGASFHPPPMLHIPAPPPYSSTPAAEINYYAAAAPQPPPPPPVDPRDIAMEAMLASRDEAVRRLMGSADDQLMRMAVTAAGALNVSNGYAALPPSYHTTATAVGLASLIGTKQQQQQLHISVNPGRDGSGGSVLAYPDDSSSGATTTFRTSLLTPRGTTVISSRTPAPSGGGGGGGHAAAATTTRGRSGFTQRQPPPPLTMNILAPPSHHHRGGGGSWDTSFSAAFPPAAAAAAAHMPSHPFLHHHAHLPSAAANTTSFSGSMGDKGMYLRAVTPSKGGGSTVTQVHQHTSRGGGGERMPPPAPTWDDPLASFGGGAPAAAAAGQSRSHHHHHNSRDPLASFRGGSGGGGSGGGLGGQGGGYLTYGGKSGGGHSSPSSKPFIQLPIAPASLAVSLGLGGQWE